MPGLATPGLNTKCQGSPAVTPSATQRPFSSQHLGVLFAVLGDCSVCPWGQAQPASFDVVAMESWLARLTGRRLGALLQNAGGHWRMAHAREPQSSSLQELKIDHSAMQEMGLNQELSAALYRALYLFVVAFNEHLTDMIPGGTVQILGAVSRIWKAFVVLAAELGQTIQTSPIVVRLICWAFAAGSVHLLNHFWFQLAVIRRNIDLRNNIQRMNQQTESRREKARQLREEVRSWRAGLIAIIETWYIAPIDRSKSCERNWYHSTSKISM